MGLLINGRYEIVRVLGVGSMGTVYLCRHKELADTLVALKVLFPEVSRDAVTQDRFRRELTASYEVRHPNVVRPYEYFKDDDIVAYSMEYVDGGDLADYMTEHEPLTLDDVCIKLEQICSGLSAIHAARIIHRDLRPENVLLTADGVPKISDFGVSLCETGQKLPEQGGVVGTIDYVSPEYLESGVIDRRSDLYAVGVMAYEMLVGDVPFQGESVIDALTLRLETEPPCPRVRRADCPEELAALVRTAMARNPNERFQNAGDLSEALHSLQLGWKLH